MLIGALTGWGLGATVAAFVDPVYDADAVLSIQPHAPGTLEKIRVEVVALLTSTQVLDDARGRYASRVAVSELRARLSFRTEPLSPAIVLTASGETPEDARTLLKAFFDASLDHQDTLPSALDELPALLATSTPEASPEPDRHGAGAFIASGLAIGLLVGIGAALAAPARSRSPAASGSSTLADADAGRTPVPVRQWTRRLVPPGWLVVGCALVGGVASLVTITLTPTEYQAEAVLRVGPRPFLSTEQARNRMIALASSLQTARETSDRHGARIGAKAVRDRTGTSDGRRVDEVILAAKGSTAPDARDLLVAFRQSALARAKNLPDAAVHGPGLTGDPDAPVVAHADSPAHGVGVAAGLASGALTGLAIIGALALRARRPTSDSKAERPEAR